MTESEDLKPYEVMETLGWTWFVNTTREEAQDMLKELGNNPGSDEYTIGGPKPGPKYSGIQLQMRGIVGVYRRGGKRVRIEPDYPTSPIYASSPAPPSFPAGPFFPVDSPPLHVFHCVQ